MPHPIDSDMDFFATIAHDIRQPLSSMQSALQLLKKCEDTQVRDHAYRAIDPFTQGENSASGFGLGLAIVKQLVELQGGTVEAFSAGLERGSRFVVSLPPPMVANHLITSAARLLPQSQC